ncbi:MAG TPA: hypothetical protein VKI44_27145 [Acetobacteraceae bacterium]|nr:hypothetical protein [Acetobacteraceae bacterium]
MRSRYLAWPIAALLSALSPTAAFADSGPAVLVRVGIHEGYSRIAFNLASWTDYHVTQQGQHVVVQFAGNLMIGPANAVPRNVVAITGGASQADIVVEPGTTVRDWRFGNVVVIDVADPDSAGGNAAIQKAGATQPPPAKSPAPSPIPTAAPPPTEPPTAPKLEPSPIQTKSEATNPQPEPAPMAAAPTDPAPVPTAQATPAATVADIATQPTSSVDAAIVVPSDAQLGVAAFRRGSAALIVFDQPRNIDLSPLRDDPVFGTAIVQTLQTSTVIRLTLDPAMAVSTLRTPGAWRITAVPLEPTLRPIQAAVVDDRFVLPAVAPGTVVSVADPDTGATLLVGTQRRDGQGVPAARHSPEFTLLPTWQGVAVEATADTVTLRPAPQGFIVVGALNLSPPSAISDQLAHAAGLTRQFDFPSQPVAALQQRLQGQVVETAAAPPLARGPRRQAAARTMIALGLGAEAGAMLRMAAADDPHEADSPDNTALAAIAALLAHRPDEADGLADPRLPATDDIALWRAVRQAQLQEGSPQAAATFGATLPLLLAYPPEMRDCVLPLVAETLVTGGELATASALFAARKGDSALDLARAMLQAAQGDSIGALASYDRLAQSRDQSVHARAAARAVELRLASGAIGARQAADQLESLLYSWRGDQYERAQRERLAELKARTGAWRSALALLRDSETLFRDDKAEIHSQLADMFAELLRDDTADALAPLELVSVVEENADLLPAGPDGEALQAKLADRLVALDLPKRAGPVLERLMLAAKSGIARAGFGARLATLRLHEGDATGALAALGASVADDLPAELVERRTLLLAAADTRRGDAEHALVALGTLNSAAADEARATILERANDWPAAQRALADYAAKTVPAEGRLDDVQRRALLRLATAAARAGDDAALTALRQREGARMETGPLADMFRLLTADQVRSAADLKRSGQEAALAHELPGQLKALQAPAQQTP